MTHTMASKSTLLPLLRREVLPTSGRSWKNGLTGVAYRRYSAHAAPARRRRATRREFISSHAVSHTRSFATTLSRKSGEERDTFDPAHIERECDEVDVCIVGGGKGPLAVLYPIVDEVMS